MIGAHFFVPVSSDLLADIIMFQIICAFFYKFFHAGISFQVCSDFKVFCQFFLKIGYEETAASQNDNPAIGTA